MYFNRLNHAVKEHALNALLNPLHVGYIYIYAFSTCFYPKRLTVHSDYTFFCQYVFPGNRTHNLCATNAMLYHWATGTQANICVHSVGVLSGFCKIHDIVKLHIVKTTLTILSQTIYIAHPYHTHTHTHTWAELCTATNATTHVHKFTHNYENNPHSVSTTVYHTPSKTTTHTHGCVCIQMFSSFSQSVVAENKRHLCMLETKYCLTRRGFVF